MKKEERREDMKRVMSKRRLDHRGSGGDDGCADDAEDVVSLIEKSVDSTSVALPLFGGGSRHSTHEWNSQNQHVPTVVSAVATTETTVASAVSASNQECFRSDRQKELAYSWTVTNSSPFSYTTAFNDVTCPNNTNHTISTSKSPVHINRSSSGSGSGSGSSSCSELLPKQSPVSMCSSVRRPPVTVLMPYKHHQAPLIRSAMNEKQRINVQHHHQMVKFKPYTKEEKEAWLNVDISHGFIRVYEPHVKDTPVMIRTLSNHRSIPNQQSINSAPSVVVPCTLDTTCRQICDKLAISDNE